MKQQINSLTDFIHILEKNNELIRIKEFVNPELEISEITDRISKQPGGGKAILFENTGTKFPVLINAFGSEKRIKLALRVKKLDDIGAELDSLMKEITGPKNSLIEKLKLLPTLQDISSWMPKRIAGKGKCQEVIIHNPDITKLPILKCWPNDGGKFITLPIVNTRDPHTGIRNIGMYRMQIFGPALTAMHWHKHKVGARHYNDYKSMNKKMPVAVALGGDPVTTYCATAPLPDNIDEYILAGFLRKKSVELVHCISHDIEVPADSDFIIEGYIDPSEEMIWEGPFGDHTGFYSLADWYPRFHITCITHRKDAVYPATIVGIPPQEDAYLIKASERIFLTPIKLSLLPEVTDMDMPLAGVAHNLVLVNLVKSFAGQAYKAMNALWGAGQMMFNKVLIITDTTTSITNYRQLAKELMPMFNPAGDIHFSSGPLDVLDHSSPKFAYGSKMLIDITKKYPEEILQVLPDVKIEQSETDNELLKKLAPEIYNINSSLISDEILFVAIAFKKTFKNQVKDICKRIIPNTYLSKVKILLFVDDDIEINNLETLFWITFNNIDPKRDCFIMETNENNQMPKLIVDATRKSAAIDGFERDWPNIIVMDDKTISDIDNKWEKFKIGNFIASPSLNFKKMMLNNSEIAHKK